MKYARALLVLLTVFLTATLALEGAGLAAWGVFFIGSAAVVPWSEYRAHAFSANIIADGLTMTRVLDAAILGLRAGLAPTGLFSRAINRDAFNGAGNDSDNSITVPVYEFGNGSSVRTRTPGTAYSTLVSDTSTGSRKLSIDKERVVGLSFTNEEAQNQTSFDPVQHGMIKGHELALVVLNDIFSSVRYGNFPNATIAPLAASAFDENDVADLAQLGMEAFWPQMPMPGLALNPAYHFGLVKQPALIDSSKAGSPDALRMARVNQIMGFNEVGSAGLPLNNVTGTAFTAVAATNVCTSTAHGLLTGDQVIVSSATTLPAGLAASTYYYARVISANTFTLHSTLAGAVADTGVIDITDTGTGTHTVTLRTNLAGVAGAPSAIITGFRPVVPTPGIAGRLVNFELVDDAETGLTLEYRHIANEDKGEEYQMISVHYGYTFGLASALKLISKPANS
jgi:hypothetical protein